MTEAENQLLADTRDRLLEHFDTVRIFVTTHSGASDNTANLSTGGGNFYAQLGQVHEWMAMQDQIARETAKSKNSET